jgi:hypothetical protein
MLSSQIRYKCSSSFGGIKTEFSILITKIAASKGFKTLKTVIYLHQIGAIVSNPRSSFSLCMQPILSEIFFVSKTNRGQFIDTDVDREVGKIRRLLGDGKSSSKA